LLGTSQEILTPRPTRAKKKNEKVCLVGKEKKERERTKRKED